MYDADLIDPEIDWVAMQRALNAARVPDVVARAARDTVLAYVFAILNRTPGDDITRRFPPAAELRAAAERLVLTAGDKAVPRQFATPRQATPTPPAARRPRAKTKRR